MAENNWHIDQSAEHQRMKREPLMTHRMKKYDTTILLHIYTFNGSRDSSVPSTMAARSEA
jgi:hypothetical protein